MSDSKPIFGIDLGTTYSAIAHVDAYGVPVVIKNITDDGSATIPSAIYIGPGGDVVVGETAKTSAPGEPDRVFQEVKRGMGDSNYSIEVDGKEYRAEMLSSLILRKIADYAGAALATTVEDVVITCPAYFNDNEREATRKAGEMAGLNVRQILNEPTAAALSYGIDKEQAQTVLVYDLGGGTFDITVIEVAENAIEVVVTGGDRDLGGKLWDRRLVNYIAAEYEQAQGNNPLDDPETSEDLMLRAEKVKRDLTNKSVTTVNVNYGRPMKLEITRTTFETLTADLLQRSLELTRELLDSARQKGVSKMDTVLLVGGSTRMPQVAQALKETFGFDAKLFDPDESVAKGAALMGLKIRAGELLTTTIKETTGAAPAGTPVSEAAIQEAEVKVAEMLGLPPSKLANVNKTRIVNVASHSLGIVCLDENDQEVVDTLIAIQTPLPAFITNSYRTVEDFQDSIEIQVMEGESRSPLDCKALGKFPMQLPPNLPRGAGIEVTFRLNEEGKLEGEAVETTHRRKIDFQIERTGVMTKEEVAAAKSSLMKMSVS